MVLSWNSDLSMMLFFPNSWGFVNVGHTQIIMAAPNTENFILRSQEIWSCSVSMCCSESTILADTQKEMDYAWLETFLHSYIIFSQFKEVRESSSMGKKEFPRLKRAPGTAFEGGIAELQTQGLLKDRNWSLKKKSGNICCGLHW